MIIKKKNTNSKWDLNLKFSISFIYFFCLDLTDYSHQIYLINFTLIWIIIINFITYIIKKKTY